MPKQMERKLKKRARRLKNQGRLKGSVKDYVYGAMRKTGWKPKQEQ